MAEEAEDTSQLQQAEQMEQSEQNDDDDSGDQLSNVPEIELIIKASTIDGRRKGACLFCQEYFMDLYLLAELKTISLKVTTVDMLKPPPHFRSSFDAAIPPILVDQALAVLQNEEIERHIMKNVPGGHNLFVQAKDVEEKIGNVFPKFKRMLNQNGEKFRAPLITALTQIDEHLKKNDSCYLTGDTVCVFDCELMPKLQHVRVAGKFFMDFEIPETLTHLWRYMANMYQLDAFTQSCPADQDIIHHYRQQQQSKMSRHQELEAPSYSTSVPASCNTD